MNIDEIQKEMKRLRIEIQKNNSPQTDNWLAGRIYQLQLIHLELIKEQSNMKYDFCKNCNWWNWKFHACEASFCLPKNLIKYFQKLKNKK